MPGWYIHMNVARKALAKLQQNAEAAAIFGQAGPDAKTLTKIAKANPAYVALGAVGPDIFFLLPDFKPPMGSMVWKLASFVQELYTAWDENFQGPLDSALGPIGNTASDEINALTGGLKASLERIFGQAFALLKDSVIKLISQQYDCFGLLTSGVPAGMDEQSFFWSDMLHYRETYRFSAVLWQRACAEKNAKRRSRFQAYALGWMSHLATDVTGHPFVNQKTGGPFRLHWQRHHLVENHMDAVVYNSDHGSRPIYQQMANSALHLWLAFNPDGSSRVNSFLAQPNPSYPPGDSAADITQRHAVWDFDSEMPDELAALVADTLKAVYKPSLSTGPTGMAACCPTIIGTLKQAVPLQTNGHADKDDIRGAYWWLYRYVKWTTTDFYKIRRPPAPSVVVIPSFPLPPGAGDADPGPGATEDQSVWKDLLEALLALFAWVAYLAEVAAYLPALLAGIINGAITYPLREALYEYVELPLYNAWLAIHTYLAMTGYVMPMPGEINMGLTTLGMSVAEGWVATNVALNDPDGGLTPATFTADPSGSPAELFPRNVLVDPPGFITKIFADIFKLGAPEVNGQFPSEFSRPWLWPGKDNQGNPVGLERPVCLPGHYLPGMDATALFGGMPGTNAARAELEGAPSEAESITRARTLLGQNQHLGDPQDYAAYVIAKLTRDGLAKDDELDKLANFNLDSDRGYAYLCWDWIRTANEGRKAVPSAFAKNVDPATGTLTDVSTHAYRTPLKPGYGWESKDDPAYNPNPAGPLAFDPDDPTAEVQIRYIDREPKFK